MKAKQIGKTMKDPKPGRGGEKNLRCQNYQVPPVEPLHQTMFMSLYHRL